MYSDVRLVGVISELKSLVCERGGGRSGLPFVIQIVLHGLCGRKATWDKISVVNEMVAFFLGAKCLNLERRIQSNIHGDLRWVSTRCGT